MNAISRPSTWTGLNAAKIRPTPPSIPDSSSARKDVHPQFRQVINGSNGTSDGIEEYPLRFRKCSFEHVCQMFLTDYQLKRWGKKYNKGCMNP